MPSTEERKIADPIAEGREGEIKKDPETVESLSDRLQKVEEKIKELKNERIKDFKDRLQRDVGMVRIELAASGRLPDFENRVKSLSEKLSQIEYEIDALLSDSDVTVESSTVSAVAVEKKEEKVGLISREEINKLFSEQKAKLLEWHNIKPDFDIDKDEHQQKMAWNSVYENLSMDNPVRKLVDQLRSQWAELDKKKDGFTVGGKEFFKGQKVKYTAEGKSVAKEYVVLDKSEDKKPGLILDGGKNKIFAISESALSRIEVVPENIDYDKNTDQFYLQTGEAVKQVLEKLKKELESSKESGTEISSSESVVDAKDSEESISPEYERAPSVPDSGVKESDSEDGIEKMEEKNPVDIPVSLMKEIVLGSGLGKKIAELVLSSERTKAIEEIKNIFDKLDGPIKDKILKVLESAGYTLEEFIKLWKEGSEGKGSLAESVTTALQGKIDAVRKRRASESITFADKIKTNWKSIAKRALLVAGVAGAAALTAGVALGGIAAVGAGIGAGGFFGRFLTRKKAQAEKSGEIDYRDEAAKMRLDDKIKEYEEDIVLELAEEIEKDGIDEYLGSLISQGVLEATSGNAENANAELLKYKILKKVSAELKREGKIDAEQALQLENLVDQISQRKNLSEAAAKANASPVVMRIVEKFMQIKGGTLDVDTDSNVKNIAGYVAPLAVGSAVMAAGMLGGGVVTEGVRAGLAGLGFGFMGYKGGEALDLAAKREAIMKEIKDLMKEVSDTLSVYKQGADLGVNRDELKRKIEVLDGHLKIGSMDADVLLKTRAEALVREGRRELFELDKEGEIKLGGLLEALSDHRAKMEEQAQADIQRIIKKTKDWRRWVGLAGGAIGGVLLTIGLIELRQPGGSSLLHGDRPKLYSLDSIKGGVGKDGMPDGIKYETIVQEGNSEVIVDGGENNSQVAPVDSSNTSTSQESLIQEQKIDTAVIGEKKGILHAAAQLEKSNPDIFKGMSERDISRWEIDQLKKMGFQFRDGKWGYPNTVHPGARVELLLDTEGKPKLHLIEDSRVSTHDIKWVDAVTKKTGVGDGVGESVGSADTTTDSSPEEEVVVDDGTVDKQAPQVGSLDAAGATGKTGEVLESALETEAVNPPDSTGDVTPESPQTTTLTIGGRDIKIPADLYDEAGANKIIGIKRLIEDMPEGPEKQRALDGFSDAIKDPKKFDVFARQFERHVESGSLPNQELPVVAGENIPEVGISDETGDYLFKLERSLRAGFKSSDYLRDDWQNFVRGKMEGRMPFAIEAQFRRIESDLLQLQTIKTAIDNPPPGISPEQYRAIQELYNTNLSSFNRNFPELLK